MALFYISQNFLLSALIEDSWTLISAFSLLCHHKPRRLWNTPLYTFEALRVKNENNFLVLLWKSFWTHETLTGLRDPARVLGQYFENQYFDKLCLSLYSGSFWVLLVCLQHHLDFTNAHPCRVTWELEYRQLLDSWQRGCYGPWIAHSCHAVQETWEISRDLDPASRDLPSSALWWPCNLNESPQLVFKGKKKNIHLSLANWKSEYIPVGLGEQRGK